MKTSNPCPLCANIGTSDKTGTIVHAAQNGRHKVRFLGASMPRNYEYVTTYKRCEAVEALA